MESVIDLARRSPLDSDAHVESFHAKLLELIKKTGEKKLAGSVDKVMADLLLSPAHGQGLACAELLVVKLAAANFEVKDLNLLIEQCRAVLLGISARDARVGSKAVTILARQMTKAMLSTDKCMRGLGALKAIVEKITGQSSTAASHKSASQSMLSSVPFAHSSFVLFLFSPSVCPWRCDVDSR